MKKASRLLAIVGLSLCMILWCTQAWAQRGGRGGGGFRGGAGGGFRGPSMGGFRGPSMGGFRGPSLGGFRGPGPSMGGFRGAAPNLGGMRAAPNLGGFRGPTVGSMRPPAMGGFRGAAPNLGPPRTMPNLGASRMAPSGARPGALPNAGALRGTPNLGGFRGTPGAGAGAAPGLSTRSFGRTQSQYGLGVRPSGIQPGSRAPLAGGLGGALGTRPPWGAGAVGRVPGQSPLGGGSRLAPTGFNPVRAMPGRGGAGGVQGLGWRNPYTAYHQSWMRGGGNIGGGRLTNINSANLSGRAAAWGYGRGYGGWGYPGWGRGGWGLGRGWGRPGWGWGGWGWGWNGFGLGFGLGWGLGSLGLGWGYPGWGWGLGGLGWGLGWNGWGLGGWGGYGLSSWLYGPMLYDWGYWSYFNPYYLVPSAVVVEQPTTIVTQPSQGYDYSQPINPTSAEPAASATDQALALFDQARASFRAGDYSRSLDLTDQAIALSPNDPTLHEFRGLALFALKRYEEAATPLYAVLSIGPGWDWPTLIGLYPNVEVYTRQLRDLEFRVRQNLDSAPPRFVLAYHYMAQGHVEAAASQFREIVRLEPRDTVSAQLLRQLRSSTGGGSATPGASGSPGSSPASAPPPKGRLTGTWVARPADQTTITVTFTEGGRFTWRVEQQGRSQEFQGDLTYGNGILTLAPTGQEAQPPMVGRLSWEDEDRFTFKLIGGPPDDPGLRFRRSL